MGVIDLWSVLAPICERKSLWELQNKTIAIDLSGWVCDSCNIVEFSNQPRMYLRNLFFRTSCLLMLNVQPVFVLEGTPPELKHDTIVRRNRKGFQENKNPVSIQNKKTNRSHFQGLLKKCRELLRIMGLNCVQSWGEAEALCAQLNNIGLVDGCISQDGDCFLYGAKTVYRNFTTGSHGSGGSVGYSVDLYKLEDIQTKLSLGRNKLIAMSLLCGCDYNHRGVQGIGKETALKFLVLIDEKDILQRLKLWRDCDYLDDLEKQRTAVLKGVICEHCGHEGQRRKHEKSGCSTCGLSSNCILNPDKQKLRDPAIELELNVRRKALADPNFPNLAIIQEFLQEIPSTFTEKIDTTWKQPNLWEFIKFSSKMLNWDQDYAIEKFLPILSRWQLMSLIHLKEDMSILPVALPLSPESILKKRTVKGVQSFEIQWSDRDGCLKNLSFEKEKELENFLVTVEPQELIEKAYPNIVDKFLEEQDMKKSLKCKKKSSKAKKITSDLNSRQHKTKNSKISENEQLTLSPFFRKMQKRNPLSCIENLLGSLSLEEKQENIARKKGSSNHLQNTCINDQRQEKSYMFDNEFPLKLSLEANCSTPVSSSCHDISCVSNDCDLCEADSFDMSEIIKGIVGEVK